jgi:hypothetical protein
MSEVVRYFDAGDEVRRIVENDKTKWQSTGPGRFDRKRVSVRRWLTIERYNGSEWVEVEEMGDYVTPKDAPHR